MTVAEVKINLNNQRRVHYVLSTHWDREWFLTQQGRAIQRGQLGQDGR